MTCPGVWQTSTRLYGGPVERYWVKCQRLRGHTGVCWYYEDRLLYVWGWKR